MDLIDRIAMTSCIPIRQWYGKCYLIAMALLACEDSVGELVTGFYHTDNGMVSDHAWIEYPDGSIADPTRWTMENTSPEIYRGQVTSNYDKDGLRWEKELEEIYKPLVQSALMASRLRATFLAIDTLEDLKKGKLTTQPKRKGRAKC